MRAPAHSTTWTSKHGPKTTVVTTTTTTVPEDDTEPVERAVPKFNDQFTRTYLYNGERWVEVDTAKPLNWHMDDDCPIYGTEESAYAAGFDDGQLQERLAVLRELSERVAKYEDMEFGDAVDVVWDRMSDEDKEDTWPV